MRSLLLLSLFLVACGDDDSPAPDAAADARDAMGDRTLGDADTSPPGDADSSSGSRIGMPCTGPGDCPGGTCLDYSQVDSTCMGSVCTITCEGNEDCEGVVPAEFDCDPVDENPGSPNYCLSTAWEPMLCR